MSSSTHHALPTWWGALTARAGELATSQLTPAHGELLAELVERACSRWPHFEPGAELLAVKLGEQLAGLQVTEVDDWLARLMIEDYYLAISCGQHDEGAIKAFEELFERDFDRLTRRFQGQRFHTSDLRQILLEKLFVGPCAKIHDYTGRGHLQNWFRVTATRTFIDLVRQDTPYKREEIVESETIEHALLEDDHAHDYEMAFLKQEYRAEFKLAFAQALTALDANHRTILRQNLVEGMSIDQLAALYGSHRSSAARWLGAAREALLRATHEALMDRLNISRQELDSIMTLIRSNFEVSMSRLLRAELPES